MTASGGEGARERSSTPALCPLTLSRRLLPIAIALLVGAACSGPQTPAGGTPPAGASPATPQVTQVPDVRRTAQPPATPAAPADSLILTIWGPDFMAPLQDAPGGTVLAAQIDAFTKAHPGWQVHYVRKKPYGQGGLVHFLRSTAVVAPELLPDLVLLDMSEVGLLANDSLLQALDSQLGPDITSDLFPFAQEAGRLGNALVAAQYGADVRFLAYNSAIIQTPPSTWAEILASDATYLLPIGGSEGAVRDAFLPQYLALGGKLTDRDGRPYLDKAVVAAILEVYQAAHQSNLLPEAGFDLKDANDCWPLYLTSTKAVSESGDAAKDSVAMTNVTSWDYGRERARLVSTRVAPLPTLSGTLTSMSTGWGWVLLSKDPSRQAAASTFLRSILQPESMAAWSRTTYHLPTRRSALPLAIKDEDYLRFLQRLMEVAVPQPSEPHYSLATEALRAAIENVTRGALSPEAAAEEAAERMRNAQGQ